ncbi:MAG: hypothetical protein MHM6MM_009394, partial [Cercozoa sp. M6MM]
VSTEAPSEEVHVESHEAATTEKKEFDKLLAKLSKLKSKVLLKERGAMQDDDDDDDDEADKEDDLFKLADGIAPYQYQQEYLRWAFGIERQVRKGKLAGGYPLTPPSVSTEAPSEEVHVESHEAATTEKKEFDKLLAKLSKLKSKVLLKERGAMQDDDDDDDDEADKEDDLFKLADGIAPYQYQQEYLRWAFGIERQVRKGKLAGG